MGRGRFGRAALAGLLLSARVQAQPGEREDAGVPLTRFGGFMQVDWVIHRQSSVDELDPATREALNQDRFLLRRARAGVESDAGYVLGRLELDANTLHGVSVRPYEAQMAVRWPRSERRFEWIGVGREPAFVERRGLSVMATLGLFRIPFGHDATEPALGRALLERTSMVRAFFPGQRDFGVGLDVDHGPFQLSLAWMNGAPIGESGLPAPDFNRSKDVVGRVGVAAVLASTVRFALGFSGLSGTGFHPGTAETKDQLLWTDGNENGLVELAELSLIPGAPATPSRNFSRFGLGADARVAADIPLLGELCVFGEVIRGKNLDRGVEPADPVGSGRDLRELGWAVGVTQELTRHAGVAVRYDRYDPDSDARRQQAARIVPSDARYSTLALAAYARLPPLRLIGEYDHNDNALGRDVDGSPTTLADDVVAVRGELVF